MDFPFGLIGEILTEIFRKVKSFCVVLDKSVLMTAPIMVYISVTRVDRGLRKTAMLREQGGRKSVVRHTSKELVKVENDRRDRGKILVYMAPNETEKLDIFHVGISWDSLKKLAEGALCDIFFWEVTDGSLRIRGTRTRWRLLFANRKTGSFFDVSLSPEETASLKGMLFDDEN